jgi:ATP-binding cassette subfamily B protein
MTSEHAGELEFRSVSFAYPDASDLVLDDISFTAKPGETTVIIGSTGSGKTTIVNLIPRFYDVTKGDILINGTSIRSMTLADLRRQLGYVPQKSVLFSGTIQSNLEFADQEASLDELWLAADISQAREFIEAKPEGLDTEISQGGTNVSGGQRQRLSIARALVKKPQFFIFDDSFSALDFKTDTALRSALRKETGESTVVTITQRVSTAMSADQIVVLDHGRIVGCGKHKELLKDCNVYQEIAYSQLSEEDLA